MAKSKILKNIASIPITKNKISVLVEIEKQRINEINDSLSEDGFDFRYLSGSRESFREGLTSRGVFFLGKNYLTELLSHTDTIGIWIWLIKIENETQIIVSRAGRSSTPTNIPDLNLPFQIHSAASRTGFSERFTQSNDLVWKNLKKNEGRFNITKGFFVGKRAFLNNLGETEIGESILGVLVEVFQDSENFPFLSISKYNSRKKITEIGRAFPDKTPPITTGIRLAGGGANSRPSPPYGGE